LELQSIKEEILVDLKYLVGHPLFLSLLAFLAGLVLILFQTMPPRKIVMATPPYLLWTGDAEIYKKIFADNGIELVQFPTTGSEEVARRLMDPNDPIEVGFVSSGTIDPDKAKNVSTMGRVWIAPLWIFYRKGAKAGKPVHLTDFTGKRINISQVGTKANSLAKKLLSINELEIDNHISQLETSAATDAMLRVDLVVVIFFSPPAGDNIKKLISNPSIELLNMDRADTYTFIFDYLEKLTIPEGALDMARNIPHQPTQVIAGPIELLVKNNLHPSLKMLLLRAASEVHGSETYFFRRGTFPSFGPKLLPEDEEAQIYYKYGVPRLSRYLPFWAVDPFNRMLIYTVPITLIIFTMMKNLMEYRLSRGRRKIHAFYERLRELEKEIPLCGEKSVRDNLNSSISTIENEAMHLRLPEELLGEYFTLLNNISSLRIRIPSGHQIKDEPAHN